MITPLVALVSATLLQASPLSGEVRDSVTKAPISGVIVTVVATRRQTTTGADGRFAVDLAIPARVRFERAGYAPRESEVTSMTALTVLLSPSPRSLEAVTVTALRGGAATDPVPISQRTITREEIERRYFGQDVPLLLQGAAPSVTAHAETGNYWGYSYIRLRGIDQSRINLTIDGIPLNDPEDQVLYFADFPDLANSLESVQVQRGVGTSAAGTASFAGSINFETTPLAARRGSELQLAAGSFRSRRVSAEYHSGLLARGFAFYARLSALQSTGYRYHSGVLGRSAFVSAGYFGARDVVKVMATAGLLRDTLSYLAVPAPDLVRDRRINPLQPTELDRFGEQLVSAAYTRLLGASASLSTTLYRISASGNYDVSFAPDLYNYHLDFAWYGLTSAWSWQRQSLRASVGINANRYARDHYAYLRPDLETALYFNTGHKADVSGFAKVAYDIRKTTVFGDLQLRGARFSYDPDARSGVAPRAISWRFANPKIGVTYRAAPTLQLYASYGTNSREPARNDMFAGFDNLDASSVAFIGDLTRVRPETVRDAEAGLTLRTSALRAQANIFSMDFRNEIAPIGALSSLGLPLRKNVRASYRRGVELDIAYDATSRVTVATNATVMKARIDEYTDDAAGLTFRDVAPLLTPQVVANQRLDVRPTTALSVGIEGRYTSRSQLDNTGNAELVLPAAYVLDASGSWRFAGSRHALELRVNNLTNSKRFGSGYGIGGVPNYFVLPPRNLFATVKLAF